MVLVTSVRVLILSDTDQPGMLGIVVLRTGTILLETGMLFHDSFIDKYLGKFRHIASPMRGVLTAKIMCLDSEAWNRNDAGSLKRKRHLLLTYTPTRMPWRRFRQRLLSTKSSDVW